MKKCNRVCSVFGCKNKQTNSEHHFHTFPTKGERQVIITNKFGIPQKIDKLLAWKRALLLKNIATKHMTVCSNHFCRQDYCVRKADKTVSRRLKPDAVPSMNLPGKCGRKILTKERHERCERRQQLREQHTSYESSLCMDVSPDTNDFEETLQQNSIENFSSDDQIRIASLIDEIRDTSSTTTDVGVQVNTGYISSCFVATITNEQSLKSLTGIVSFDFLNTITNLVKDFYPQSRQAILSVKEKIILVMMKLKLGLTFKVLSFFFNISPSLVGKIFGYYIQMLSNILKSCIVWPSSEECNCYRPKCFKDFPNVRVILDCIEFHVEKPKCLCCRVKTYSIYKGGQTIKVMTGVSPSALITFVSKSFGGRSSDKAIFNNSALITKLEPHKDAIMVDKGFLIEDECNRHFIKLVRPLFLRSKQQFSKEESMFNRNVARARVHVERVNARLRMFHILNSTIPWSLVKHIDDIVSVCCSLVNLQSPMIGLDKF